MTLSHLLPLKVNRKLLAVKLDQLMLARPRKILIQPGFAIGFSSVKINENFM